MPFLNLPEITNLDDAQTLLAFVGVREMPDVRELSDKRRVEILNRVFTELRKVPTQMIRSIRQAGMTLDLVRHAVTDHPAPEILRYKGAQPAGWEKTDKTWDDVPATGGRLHPSTIVGVENLTTGDGHGSVNLVLHEYAHTYDLSVGWLKWWRKGDWNRNTTLSLAPIDLLVDPGKSEHSRTANTNGLSRSNHFLNLYRSIDFSLNEEPYMAAYLGIPEEGFAESFARFFHSKGTRSKLKRQYPRLHNYFMKHFGSK